MTGAREDLAIELSDDDLVDEEIEVEERRARPPFHFTTPAPAPAP